MAKLCNKMAMKRKYTGKRKYGKKLYRKPKPTTRRKLVALIKKTVVKKAEPKEKATVVGQTQLFHNCFYNVLGTNSGMITHLNNGIFLPAQGTGDNQRVGDQIDFTGWKIRLLIGQKADRPNVNFRYIVFKVPKGSSITYANWFKATSNNVMLDDPNLDFVKVIQSGFWRPNDAGLGGTGGDEFTFTKRLWIPYKKNLKFGPADAAVTHNDEDIYFSLMCYDAYGSLEADNVAYAQAVVTAHYRDP